MNLINIAFTKGTGLYFKMLPFSMPLANLMLLPVEKLNGKGAFVRVIRRANKDIHPLSRVLERLSVEISPRCREAFISHHIPLLFDTTSGNSRFFPKVLIISVTSRCNFICPDCFNNTFSKKGDLPTEDLDRVLFEAEEKGTRIVALSGGEPFIRGDLLDIIKRHPGIYFQIFTNGSFITHEVAREIAGLGNVMPFMSIEGDEKITDLRRGSGCYQRVKKSMKFLNQSGVIFGANVMVTPENLESATSDEFIKNLIDAGALMIWYITYRPIGKDPDFKLVLSKEKHLELYQKVQWIRNKYPIVALENLHDVSFFGGCPAKLGAAIHIDHKGNVTPCPPLHFYNENIIGQSLEKALNDSPFIKEVMKRKERGCIILEDPEELKYIVKKTGAMETDGGCDLETLSRFISHARVESEPSIETERFYDVYLSLKEALRDG